MRQKVKPTRRRRSKRRGRRSLIFTREVLDAIPVWIEMGARPDDIAAAVGATVGSLQVRCSQAGISLAPPAIRSDVIKPHHWTGLQRAAMRRGTSVPRLMAEIIVGVVEYDLFAAVLGDNDDEDAAGPQCAAR